MIYVIIYFAKLVEVTLATLRTVFVAKGERNVGVVISVFEITIWVVLTGTVVTGIVEDPMKIVAYILGFSSGFYLGSWLEEKIALGFTNLNIVASESVSEKIIEVLKSNETGYTMLDSHGQKENNKYIIAYVSRNRKSIF